MRSLLAALLLLAPLSAQASGQRAAPAPRPTPMSEAGGLCLPAIEVAERAEQIPGGLLRSIAHVESARPDPISGRYVPWPWTINAEGEGRYFESKDAAIAATRALLAAGVRSIDVGCAQVNLMHHPAAFASLDEAFDPVANTAYAARFLKSLRAATGSWPFAAAGYHSLTPERGHAYAQRVAAIWPAAAQFGPWPAVPADLPTGTGVAVPAARPDYSLYTPAFAAQMRRMDEDRARQQRGSAIIPRGGGGRAAGDRLPPAPVMLIPPPRPIATAPRPRALPVARPSRTAALTDRQGG